MSEPASNKDVPRLAELIRQSMIDSITSQAEPALTLPWARNSHLRLGPVIIRILFGIFVLAVVVIVAPNVVLLLRETWLAP